MLFFQYAVFLISKQQLICISAQAYSAEIVILLFAGNERLVIQLLSHLSFCPEVA